MIEHVIEVIELAPDVSPGRERGRLLIGAVEGRAEAAEQACHREIRLAIAVVDRRVEDCGLAVLRREPVAAPEIAVQE